MAKNYQQLEDLLYRLFKKICLREGEEFDTAATLDELGVDSLDFCDFLNVVESKLSIRNLPNAFFDKEMEVKELFDEIISFKLPHVHESLMLIPSLV